MEQKAIWIEGKDNPDLDYLNKFLEEGWEVKFTSSQAVSSGQAYGRRGVF